MRRKKQIHPGILAQRDARLTEYRNRGYNFLAEAIHSSRKGSAVLEIIDVQDSREEYQIEVTAFWDDKPDHDIRVVADVIPLPLKPFLGFVPIYFGGRSEDFIIRPNGTFVNEQEISP